jgi:ribosomal protein S18 acetylase RimI-like enzyme
MGITLRPITAEDMAFLYRVYASTREEELAQVNWDAQQKEAFLRMQFDAQHKHYKESYPKASYHIVLHDGVAIGRLYVDRNENDINIIDIALLPEFKGKGIGKKLLKDVEDEAVKAGKPIRIYVEKFNRALRLYQRLGYGVTGDSGVYLEMMWVPPTA